MAPERKQTPFRELLDLVRKLRHGLDSAVSLLREALSALQSIRQLLAESNPTLANSLPSMQLAVLEYNTNDRLRLETRNQILWVNGKPLTLGEREFFLVEILARYALHVAAMGGEQFMHREDLLDEIDHRYGTALWKHATREDIDHVVNSLRSRRFAPHGIARDLIDTSHKNKIRISTHPSNIEFAKDLNLPD